MIGTTAAIIAAIAAGASTTSAIVQSHAVNNATDAQQNANQQALDLQKQQYANAQQLYAPYRALGQTALGNLQGLAGNVPYAKYAMNLSGLNQFGSGQPPMNSAMNGSIGGGMVRMQAPDGSQQMVPQNLVPHYQQRGARIF